MNSKELSSRTGKKEEEISSWKKKKNLELGFFVVFQFQSFARIENSKLKI